MALVVSITKEKLNIILTKLHHRLEELYGPRLVRLILYGSQARGDAEPGSDIDVLVVLEGPVSPIEEIHRASEIVAGLSLEYDEVISCMFMDRERLAIEDISLLLNIRREGIAI